MWYNMIGRTNWEFRIWSQFVYAKGGVCVGRMEKKLKK